MISLLCPHWWASSSSLPPVADWCLCLCGYMISSLLCVFIFTTHLLCRHQLVTSPSRLAYYAVANGLLRWLESSLLGHLICRRFVSSPPRLVDCAAVVDGQPRLHRRSSLPPSTSLLASMVLRLRRHCLTTLSSPSATSTASTVGVLNLFKSLSLHPSTFSLMCYPLL